MSAVPISTSLHKSSIFDSCTQKEDTSFLSTKSSNQNNKIQDKRISTRTLVLRKAGTLWMYHGSRLVGRCGVHRNNNNKDEEEKNKTTMNVTDISGAVSNRVTLHLHNGTSVRVAVPQDRCSRLTSLCSDVLCSVLSDEEATRLESYMSVVLSSPPQQQSSIDSSTRSRRRIRSTTTTKDTSPRKGELHDWNILRGVILHSFGIRCSSSSSSEDEEDGRPLKSLRGNAGDDENIADSSSTKPTNAWDSLCNSEYHSHVHIERSHVIASLRPVSRSKTSSSKGDKENRIEEDAFISTVSPILLSIPRARAFFALHLLYEDCKLSRARWNMLKPLGRLLATIANVVWSDQSSLVRAYVYVGV